MKPTLFAFILCVLSTMLIAQTNVGSSISVNTNWTKSDSPYIINSNLTIQEETILKINPGVEIQLAPGVEIIVKGALQAEGNEKAPIVFNPQKDAWKGISFEKTCQIYLDGKGSRINYCTFNYAKDGISSQSCALEISNSTIQSQVKLQSSGITAKTKTALNIHDNKILDCAIPINLEFDADKAGEKGEAIVRNNKIQSTVIGMLKLSQSAVFENNQLDKISISVSAINQEKVSIRKNKIENAPNQAIIITVVFNGILNIENNCFKGNQTNLYAIGGMIPEAINQITIKGNNFYDFKKHHVNFYGSLGENYSYDLSNNYWGDTNTEQIQKNIKDNRFDESIGSDVQLLPILRSAGNCN